ncbi:MAG: hypothetical protein FJZ93_09325 [Chloroflexi bacterium]|nr:hypothetical protein [Chloroflexota bacterium]
MEKGEIGEQGAKAIRMCVNGWCANYGPTTDYDSDHRCNICGKKTEEHNISAAEANRMEPMPPPPVRGKPIKPAKRKESKSRTGVGRGILLSFLVALIIIRPYSTFLEDPGRPFNLGGIIADVVIFASIIVVGTWGDW